MARHVSKWPTSWPPRRVGKLAAMSLAAMAVATGCGENGASDDVGGSTTDASEITTLATTTEPSAGPTASQTTDDRELGDARPGPDPSTLPDAIAPSGLGNARLPDDGEGVTALFGALPGELFGAARELDDVDPATIAARYETGDRGCAEIGLQAMDLTAAEGAFYPEDWRAQHLVALFASGADWEVEDAGRDGAVYWVTFETSCGGEGMDQDEVMSAAVWGTHDSPWAFSVAAPDAADRDTLITAFVDAGAASVEPGA